jgi:hypothetical protein
MPEKGFVCIGPYRGWCGTVHRNEQTARKCLNTDNLWCMNNLYRKSDREILNIHDDKVGRKKITVYYLRPDEEIPIPEFTEPEKLETMKLLKLVFKGFLVPTKDVVNSKEHSLEEALVVERLTILEQMKLLRRVENDGEVSWQTTKTHDSHKWEEVVDEFIELVGGI